MNKHMKRRMAAGTGIIVIVLVLVLAIVGGSTSAKSTTIAQACENAEGLQNTKIQVSGNVVDNSFSYSDDTLTFEIYDPDAGSAQTLTVRYTGGVSATFGNDVSAICTGTLDEEGVLVASILVTKCPSKYENATDALSVSKLLEYGEAVIDKPVKVTGIVAQGSLAAAGQGSRFVLQDADTQESLAVLYDGALPDEIADASSLVLTGSINDEGKFVATNVALEE